MEIKFLNNGNDEKVMWKSTKTEFTKFYHDDLAKYFEDKKKIDYLHMGIALLLSQFISHEDNILRKNGKIMTLNDIKNELGLTKATMSKAMRRLEELYIIFKTKHPEVKNGCAYYLNPDLFYRGVKINKSIKEQINKVLCVGNYGINEKQLEEIVSNNPELIEDGMKLIEVQYEINNGFIDILCFDKNNIKTIVELKVTSDNEDLIRQCVYYPSQFQEKVRMITIAPDYSKKIYDSLKFLGYVEMKQYKFKNGQLIITDYNK